jgi:maltooligosyltrehalose trehalohydrolase
LKLAAGVVILSPFMPLLFMGEEYGETASFLYFVSHSDPALIEAVRRGRKEEFAAFQWLDEPPDPQGEETFFHSKLDHRLRRKGQHKILLEFHRELLGLRRELSFLTDLGRRDREVKGYEEEKVLWVRMAAEEGEAVALFHFGQEPLDFVLPWPRGRWIKRLDSAETRWQGPGSDAPAVLDAVPPVSLKISPQSLLVYLRQDEFE